MRQNSIFIDFRNADQVNWWITKGSKKVKVKGFTNIVETATGKKIGIVINLKGLKSASVIRKNNKFLGSDLKLFTF